MTSSANVSGMDFGEVIGLIPAAGRATRLGPLPCSKELLAVGLGEGERKVRVAIDSALRNMAASGIAEARVAITENKRDIAAYLGDGSVFDLRISCHYIAPTNSTPHTLSTLLPFAGDRVCALAFPDIVFDAPNAYRSLLEVLQLRHADVALGLFPADLPQGCDMVSCRTSGELDHIDIKPLTTSLTQTWGIAVWNSTFSDFLNTFVAEHNSEREIFVGDVVTAAQRSGLRVWTLPVAKQPYIDIGTPQGLLAAWRLSG